MMIKIKEAIVVEGKYDKIKLSGIFDTLIITTEGFGIFKNESICEFIRKISKQKGIIIFTDSDRAGFLIRNYVKKIAADGSVKHAYIPDVYGKEKRKTQASKEGFLGVEGMSDEIIIDAIKNCTQTVDEGDREIITKADLFKDGLSGGENSHRLRDFLIGELSLPKRLSTNMFLDILNSLYTFDEYKKLIDDFYKGL